MSSKTEKKDTRKPSPRGLATLAFLKARFDEGADYLDIFIPLVKDTIINVPTSRFSASQVQQLLHQRHRILIPQNTLTTLLNRLTRKRLLKRDSGLYTRLAKLDNSADITEKKKHLEAQYEQLASAFKTFAAKQKLAIDTEEALALILSFLQENNVEILLGAKHLVTQRIELSKRETRIVAEFVESAISERSVLGDLIANLTEGLVVYNTAFLNDISSAARKLTGLRIFLDSHFLRQAVGYEGAAQQALARETLDLLRVAGAQCLTFDKTVQEVQAILKMYENKLGTTQGRTTLHPTLMTRYFLTRRFTPSDMRQMSALLPQELLTIGIQIAPLPKHNPAYTLDEKKLALMFANFDEETQDEPRVVHDVDCVAGILTLRAGARSTHITGAKAVFATTSVQVLATVQKWYAEEGETGVSPLVHIRALSNLAWLRRPALGQDIKIYELIAVCQAAVQPSRKTWRRFLDHLSKLEREGAITTDESVAVVVSNLTDGSLRELEDLNNFSDSTLDEVVDRVLASYASDANRRIAQVEAASSERLMQIEASAAERLSKSQAKAQSQITEVDSKLSETQELLRKEAEEARLGRSLKIAVEGKARSLAHLIAGAVTMTARILAVLGAIALVATHPFHSDAIGIIAASVIVAFLLLEVIGVLKHLREINERLALRLLPTTRRWVGLDTRLPSRPRSILGLTNRPD